ncbi:MAG: efflux RND transporter periplasmic adaptor subunit [Acutalibacter sp.]|jgi:HlyD family secretion protein
MKHKSKRPLWIALTCVLVLAAAAACLWFFWLRDLWGTAGASPVYVESVSQIAGLNTGTTPRFSGVVEPQETFEIKKDESKTVAEIYVAEGDQVTAGTALFRYDTQEMQMNLEQAKLDLEGISNRITTLENQKKDLVEEKKNASKDEQYSYTVQIQSVELQIKTEEYNADVKQQEINKLEESIQNAEVYSEVEGVVKEVNETPQTDASGQQRPFISILSSGEFRIKGTVSELNVGSLYQGQAVTVHSRVDDTQVWSGIIDTIEAEPTDNNSNNMYYGGMSSGTQSSKYNFYVTLSSRDGLILGQHVYVQPDLGMTMPEGIWLPAFYIAHDDTGSYVWAQSEKNTLEKRAVILGDYDSDNDRYQIQSGITEDDFIAYPEEDLQEGAPTTQDITQVPVEDPDSNGDASVDGGMTEGGTMDDGIMDGGYVDDGMVVDPGVAEPYAEDGTVDDGMDSQTDTEDGEGTAGLESSPMEGLAR